MADAALSSKSAASALAGTELLYCVQSGATVYATPTQLDAHTSATTRELVNKTINASSNTITNLATTHFASGVIDTSTSLSSNSDTKLATQKATKAYVDTAVASAASTGGTLAQFASTTSAQLRGVLSDETGTGAAVFATSPTLVTPVLGVASATSITADAHIQSSSAIITDSSTARTLASTDNGKIIYFTNASEITLSMASGLGAGFSCSIWQGGAGKVFFAANSQTMYVERGCSNTIGLGARASIVCPAANTFLITGAVGTIKSLMEVSGCQLYLDASDPARLTISSETATAIFDKSGNGFTANGGSSPTMKWERQNGLNVLRFNGSANYLTNGSSTLLRSVSGWTLYSVHKTTSNSTAQSIITVGNSSGGARATMAIAVTTGYRYVGGRRGNADSFAYAMGSTQTGTGWTQWTGVGDYTNTTATLYVDGVQDATNASWLTSGSTPSDGGEFWIGATSGGASLFWNGDIGAIAIFNSAHSTSVRQRIEALLKSKWGL